MLELLVHGSPFVVNRLIDAAMAAGARPAGPEEFTRRAVANNKLDLVQAEAVRDLVAAETAWQARNAREQLAGRLSCRFAALRDQLVGLLARVEAELDFAAQGVTADPADLARRLEGCREEVVALLATADAGIRIRDGVRVVITGPPNSGKSTLFNTLLGTSRAIVAPEPGTTRDVLEAELELGGLRVTLVDAAGIRRTTDPVESEGVQRAMAELVEAGVIVELWPVDGAAQEPVPEGSRRQVLGVRSKADLGGEGWRAESGWLAVSCVTGEGVEALRKELETAVSGRVPDLGGEVAISRRHRRSLERASSELAACALEIPELAAENLRWAAAAVSELIGDVVSEDVLDEVFATFCIGK